MSTDKLLSGDDWEAVLLRTEHGVVKGVLANVVAILAHHPAWSGVVAHDDSRNEPVMANPGPMVNHDDSKPWTPRPWGNADDTGAAVWFQRHGLARVSPDMVASAVGYLCAERRINPLASYLRGLRWDGQPRLERWLTTYVGAEDSVYTRAVGVAWLRGAVSRALRHGIKFDTALVLEGAQGQGKSTVLSILGGDYFTDDVRELGSKDAALQLRRSWIVEVAEMDAMNRGEVNTVKRVMACQVDNYRAPYERRPADHKRPCVFAGTTNQSTYLRDETGGRRFWPVLCAAVHPIDLEALRRDRDQLLAETVATWDGRPVVLPREVWGVAAEQQEARYQADAWEEVVGAWLAGRESTTTGEALKGALDIDAGRWTHGDQIRMGKTLRRLGWEVRDEAAPQPGKPKGKERRYRPKPADDVLPVTGEPDTGRDWEESQNQGVLPVLPVSPVGGPCLPGSEPNPAFSPSLLGELGELGGEGEKKGSPSVSQSRGPVANWEKTPEAWHAHRRQLEADLRAAGHPAPRLVSEQRTTRDLGPCPPGRTLEAGGGA